MAEPLRAVLLSLCQEQETRYDSWCREIFYRLRDEVAAYRMIEAGTDYTDFEAILNDPFASLLVCDFGHHLSFDDVVARVALQFLGLAVARRGNQPDEVAQFTAKLDAALNHAAQVFGEVPLKPNSAIIEVDRCGLNDCNVEWNLTKEPDRKIEFLSMDAVWGGNPGRDNDEEDEPWKFLSSQEITRHSQERRRQVSKLVKEQRAKGVELFARRFDIAALDAVIDQCPSLIRGWLGYVFRDTLEVRRLLFVCPGFFEALCQVLLDKYPEEGVKLFRRLDACQGFRLTDRATGIDNLKFALFDAKHGEVVNGLRKEILDRCVSDAELFEVVFVAQYQGTDSWLNGQVDAWLNSSLPYERARGIYLLGFLDNPAAGERLTEIAKAHGRSWLAYRVEAAMRIHRRNQWAKIWFKRFLEVKDDIHGWAAFRLFLRCVDRRFWLWGPAMVNARYVKEIRRLHYFSNRRAIISAARKTERNVLKLHEHLVGEKALEKKAWPWMSRFNLDGSRFNGR